MKNWSAFFLKQLESKTCSRFELNGRESVQRLYSLAGTMCPWRVILVAVDKLLDRQVKWWFYIKVTKFHTCFWPLNHYFLVPLSNLILSHISQTACRCNAVCSLSHIYEIWAFQSKYNSMPFFSGSPCLTWAWCVVFFIFCKWTTPVIKILHLLKLLFI